MLKYVMIIFFSVFCTAGAQLLPGGVDSDKDYEAYERPIKEEGEFYLETFLKVPNIENELGLEMGLNIGKMLTEDLGVGIGIYALTTSTIDVSLPKLQSKGGILRQAYFGAQGFYSLPLSGGVDINFTGLFGITSINFSEHSGLLDENSAHSTAWRLIAEPGASCSMKLSRNFWLNLNINFRLIMGADVYGIETSRLNGNVYSLSFKTIL